ncbi:M14 family metallopeptidase [Nocardioides ganghwensis]|uniref:Zinc carboxypeptidase n=1 Tax=Nocardioides ganghwensis TaxID=252230 RepID=A0A4Q2SAI9_9ACTN|nr:M14 family metallopeptidase [Nocardioides ganghwensis]MBD3944086.1 zinc carboxypeptidase [Nocardioides ganghwensis]RYC01489.1 zinc carboxypeptidase [Nocardioides ganghwensis]
MRRLLSGSVVAVAVAALGVGLAPPSSTSPPTAARSAPQADQPLDAYTARGVSAEQLRTLARQGYDLHEAHPTGDTTRVDLVLTRDEAERLRGEGIDMRLARVKGGQTVRQFAAAQAASGYTVWKSYDEPGGYRDQLTTIARDHPGVTKLVKLGTTYQGRDILALKMTQGARGQKDGSRPAAIFSATQHAREWIAPEVVRRLMYTYLERWEADDEPTKKLLQSTELWFVPVMNPDGYEYTFTDERLWRKNLRDNNGDGITQVGDGVDPNRNFPAHWGYDNEGSSDIPSSETYRGPSPASEPETQAAIRLFDLAKAEFLVNYHSNGEWLLYNDGWQIGTPTADDPIYHALSGNLDEAAIEGYHPGLSSDVLYVTNGETDGYVQEANGTLAWTPELSPGCPGCGFVFPDDEQLVAEEFERNLPFAESVAESAADPDDPKSVLGIKTKPFHLDTEDSYKSGLPAVNLSFDKSYGDPQTVAVLAKRSLGAVTAKWKVNGGPTQSGPTTEWAGGERFGMTSTHYHQVRGTVTGTDPGDIVEVWFEGGGESSESFSYEAVSESGDRVLVVAAEDYTGASPNQTPGPHYLDYYLDALVANGEDADVYDVDAQGRTAPDALGVLSHYDAAIWYTGDDVVTRTAGRGPGNVDRLALDQMLEFRAYLNEGGQVMYTGDWAGMQYTGAAVGTQYYDPKGEIACRPLPLPAEVDSRRCLALRGSGDGTNDVLQYWFGGYVQIAGDGLDDNGDVHDVAGIDDPFAGATWAMNGPDSADNQDETSSFISTSGILPVEQFPQFESWPSARWDKPGGPFDPHTGDQYVYSQLADVSYKRLTRTVDVPAGGGTLDFWTSYDTEADWDYVFVEARTPSGDDWTTLPDLNGHTSQETGESCASGWRELHPQLDHYQTYDAGTETCTASGETGEWHAASGSSSGWQEWSVDLGEWAGGQVEVSITYASDWATQNLGTFVDDVTLPDGSSTSFEAGLDGWEVPGAPPGSAANGNDWIVTDAGGFPVGAAISTPDSLLLGFGFEGIATPAERNEVMGRALEHLLD